VYLRAHETCLLAENVVLPRWEANSDPRGHFEAGKEWRKGKEGGRKAKKKTAETSPLPLPQVNF